MTIDIWLRHSVFKLTQGIYMLQICSSEQHIIFVPYFESEWSTLLRKEKNNKKQNNEEA